MAQQPPPAGYQPAGPPAPGPRPGNGVAMAGMILGIVSIVTAFLIALVGLITGIVGVILGFAGRSRAAQIGGTGAGQATAGIITGFIGIALSIIAYIIVFNALS